MVKLSSTFMNEYGKTFSFFLLSLGVSQQLSHQHSSWLLSCHAESRILWQDKVPRIFQNFVVVSDLIFLARPGYIYPHIMGGWSCACKSNDTFADESLSQCRSSCNMQWPGISSGTTDQHISSCFNRSSPAPNPTLWPGLFVHPHCEHLFMWDNKS